MSRRMDPADFLIKFREMGGVLRLDGDQIRCRAPQELVTEKLASYMRRHKPALIALLQEEAATDPDGLMLRSAVALFDGEIVEDRSFEDMTASDIAQTAQEVA